MERQKTYWLFPSISEVERFDALANLQRLQPILYSRFHTSATVRSSVRYQTCEHAILKTNEPTLMQIGKNGQRTEQGHETTDFGGSGGQRSRSH